MTHMRIALRAIATLPVCSGIILALTFCAGGTDYINGPGSADSTGLDPKRWQNGRTVASVSVTPDPSTMNVGQTLVLSAVALNSHGSTISGYPVAWVSSDMSTATVDDSGIVTGLKSGTTIVTATINGVADSASVAVTPTAPGAVTDLRVTAVDDTSATLTFTEVSDGNGGAASIDVRFAPSPINWGSAPSVKNGACTTPIPGTTVGSTITCTVGGLAKGTGYDFRLVAFRGSMYANAVYGALSNIATATTGSTQSVPTALPLPGTVTDLRITSISDTSATLRFTQVTDGTGSGANYDVRYAVAPIVWGSAPSVVNGSCATPVVGTSPGSSLTCTVLGLNASTAYEFHLVAYRGTLNQDAVFGETSNIAGATTAAATIASVVVSPAGGTVRVGGTLAFSAVAKDSHGNVIALPPTWASSNAAVASVDTSGDAFGMSSGTASVTATVGGVTGAASVTVESSGSSGGASQYPHVPAGLSVIGDFTGSPRATHDGLAYAGRGTGDAFGFSWMQQPWSWDESRTEDEALIVTADSTNPTGSGNVLRFNWLASVGAGIKSARTDPATFPSTYSTLYIMLRIYWEANNWNNTGHKFYYVTLGSDDNNHIYITREMNGGGHVTLEGSAFTSTDIITLPTGTWTDGTWYSIELVLHAESTSGAKDGAIAWYSNGTLVGSASGLNLLSKRWRGLEWYATNNSIPDDKHYRIGELYIAGK